MGICIELGTWNVLAREIPAVHMGVCWQWQPRLAGPASAPRFMVLAQHFAGFG